MNYLIALLCGLLTIAVLCETLDRVTRFDRKAFRGWVFWRYDRPRIMQGETQEQYRKALHHWRYNNRPLNPVFKPRS